uniref:DDHD domain-containing protein n=1 Tax=Macrostomum lignano TaxID=282301 RepID=A0A1I8JN51_9PLAT
LENLFCLGSPLAVFLALRGIRPKGNGTQEDIVPKSIVNRIYNIYHPADPVVTCGGGSGQDSSALDASDIAAGSGDKPSSINRFNTFLSRFTGKGQQQPPQLPSPSGDSAYSPSRLSSFRKTASASGSVASSASATAVSVSSTGPPVMSELKTFASNYVEDAADDLMLGADEANGEAAPASNSSRPAVNVYDSMQHRTELEHRLDYQLREGRYESSYVSVLTSHTAYWSHEDIALFIMSHLFPDYGPIGIPKR